MNDLDYNTESKHISNWIVKTVKQSGFHKIVVALSGGIDSAVACSLAVQTLGAENVFVLLLPYGNLQKEGLEDARLVVKSLNIPQENVSSFDIQKAVDAIVSSSHSNDVLVRKGNIMARVRMIYLFDFAKKEHVLVCGTENRSEHFLGYFTRFGDEASDLEPIRHLYKTQVRELARHLDLPSKIISKAPTAGLWHEQTDEKEFGFTYKHADMVLYLHFDKGLSTEQIVAQGLSKDTVENVLRWMQKNDFKHHLPHMYK